MQVCEREMRQVKLKLVEINGMCKKYSKIYVKKCHDNKKWRNPSDGLSQYALFHYSLPDQPISWSANKKYE